MNDKISKFTVGEKEYSFIMKNSTIFKADALYGNYAAILHGLMNGVQYYTNAVKLMVCTCIEGITEDEIIDNCTADQMARVSELAQEIYLNYIGIEETKDNQVKKNIKKDKKK